MAVSDEVLGWLVVAGVLLAWGGLYSLACWWFPFRRCWCCGGTGRHFSKSGTHLRLCKFWCGGTGRRLRVGRRLYNRIHQLRAR